MCRTLRRSFRNPDQLSTSSPLGVHHVWPAPAQTADPTDPEELVRVAAGLADLIDDPDL
jgi:hypothetical protein